MPEPNVAPHCQIDLDAALEYAGGDPDFLNQLFAVFLEEARGHLTAIRAAFTEGRLDPMTHAAHTIKGSLRLLGARETAALAERIELVGDASRLESLRPDVARFEKEMEWLLQWIEARLAEKGATS